MTKPRHPVEEFTHTHQSGKFSATAAEWDACLAATIAGCDVATFTETTDHQPTPPPGWRRLWLKGAPDVAAYVATHVWSVDGFEGPELAETRYQLGGKRLKPRLHGLVARIRTKGGDFRVRHVVVHEPSAIEGEVFAHGEASRFPRVKALFESFARIHQVKRDLRREYGPGPFVLSWDSNLDWLKMWVRVFFRVRFPSLALSFKTLPARGDLGPRLISVSLYSRRYLSTTGSVLGPARPGFDHLPFTTTYRRKRKARR